jgi:hypothetical protein
MLRNAGFTRWEIKRDGGRDSNVLLVTTDSTPTG